MEDAGRAGFTLIELLVTVAVVALLAGAAVPAMSRFVDNGRLRGAAEQLLQDLRQVRSRALTAEQDMYVAFAVPPAGRWCYGWQAREACDCRVLGDCADAADKAPRLRRADDFPGVTLRAPRGAPIYRLRFGAHRGMADATTLSLANRAGEIRVIVSPLGRTRTCAVGVPGFAAC